MANTAQTLIIGVIGIGVLLIVILIPTSFSDVEYYEVSLQVDIFYSGCFLLFARKERSSATR